jgi:mono/diheme cytochrome c family protein
MTASHLRPALFLSLLALLLTACSFSLAEDITPPPGAVQSPVSRTEPVQVSGPLYPLVPPNTGNGAVIYAEKCAPCHGSSGMGDGPRAAQLPNPVTALGSVAIARQAVPADWYTMVTRGNLESFMPPFSSLTDRERWDVVAYAFSLSAAPDEIENGARLYQANCASCHGSEGAGDGAQAAGLSTSPTDFTDQELMAQRSAVDFYQAVTNGFSPAMPAYEDRLSEAERWALVAYLRTLTFDHSQEVIASQGMTETLGEIGTPAAGIPSGGNSPQPSPETGTEVAEASPAMGIVSGSVVNQSGGKVPSDLEITLRGYDDMRQVITQTTTIQPEGTYSFEDIDMPAGRAFLVTVDYGGTTYGSDIAVAQPDTSLPDLPVAIYDTTTDATMLSVDRLHLFFEFADEDTLRVIQLYILSNLSDMTVVPVEEGKPVISFALPEGAANLEIQDGVIGERFVLTADGFGDTTAIRPGAGRYELLFAYEMPYNRELELVQPMSLPVNALVVMAPENGIDVEGDGLVDAGTRDVQGAQYRLYNRDGIAPGSDLRLTISGRSAGASPSLVSGSNTNLVIGLGAFGGALLLAGVWLYSRSRSAAGEIDQDEADEDLSEDVSEVVSESPESLMDAIIALDDLYQAGQLPESAYLERRNKLKERLKKILPEGGAKE